MKKDDAKTRSRSDKLGKRALLFSAAETMLRRYGIKRISVEEICKEARVSKMTFYKYFRSKEDLVLQILNSWLEPAYREMQAIVASERSFPEKIQLLVAQKQRSLSQLSEAFLADYLRNEGAIKAFIEQWSERAAQAFSAFLEQAQARGELEVIIKPNLFMVYLDKIWELARDQSLAAQYSSYNEYIEALNRIFFYGVVPRK